ncbi:hypothetical protein ACFQX6_65810 [Streptosporangium lutulentum]
MAITITQVEKTFPGTPSQIPQARAWTLAALPAAASAATTSPWW